VHDGKLTLFWEDAWEQEPVLMENEKCQQIKTSMMHEEWTKIFHYWNEICDKMLSYDRIWKKKMGGQLSGMLE